MLRLLAAVILLGLAACSDNQLARTGSPVTKQAEPQAAPEEEDAVADCDFIQKIASNVMRSRQLGIPASETMQFALDYERKDEVLAKLAQKIIQDAYRRPQYTTDESRSAEVAAFGDHWGTACTKKEIAGL